MPMRKPRNSLLTDDVDLPSFREMQRHDLPVPEGEELPELADYRAYVIREVNGFVGHAILVRCDPFLLQLREDWEELNEDGEIETAIDHNHQYVILAASGPEQEPGVSVFPADENGNVTQWFELEGSYKGGRDFEDAMQLADYTLVKQGVIE